MNETLSKHFLLENRISNKTKFDDFGPIYRPPIRNDEKILILLPIKINLGNKKERTVINRNLNKTPSNYFRPYNSYFFDGIVVITNQRLIIKFTNQWRSYDKNIPIDEIYLKLENTRNIKEITKHKEYVNWKSEPALNINNIRLWLLDSYPLIETGSINKFQNKPQITGSYYFATYSTYKGFIEAIEFLQKKYFDGLEFEKHPKWIEKINLIYSPRKELPIAANTSSKITSNLFVLSLLAFVATLIIRVSNLLSEYNKEISKIMLISTGTMILSLIGWIIAAFNNTSTQLKIFEEELIKKDFRKQLKE